MIPHLVIGSGPAGVAAATALLERGLEVTLIDGGQVLEADHTARAAHLASHPPRDWMPEQRADWQAPQFATPPGQVRRYGSDFAMEPAGATFAGGQDRFHLRASRAVGGLSNLWGAAILPYAGADMAGWPVSPADMAPHYRAIADFLPTAARGDDLADLFPSFPISNAQPLPPAPQAETLLKKLHDARDSLARHGLTTGQARQAVAPGCRACGQCLHGCPWGLIWKAGHQLDRLRQNPRFTYLPGRIVTHVSESAASITLHLQDATSLTAARAYLAAGVLESARILMASDPARRALILRDSAHGFLPFLHRWRAPRRPDRGPFHTLPQVFAALDAPDISARLIHAQIYSWNEFFERDLIENYARKLPGSAPLFRALARRLMVAQVFLQSDLSASARLTLAPDGRLLAEVLDNPATAPAFDAATRRFGQALRTAGMIALPFARRLNPPGSSFHAGASLPMSASPGAGQSDALGRPEGLHRLHVVDATTLPAIPATTITLAVMAHAHRIASLAG